MLKRYFRYTMPSMLAMTGFSLYILADTFFISLAEGAKGITVLNLCLPYYDIIYAVGMLIGIGSATRFSIESAQGLPQSEEYFTRSLRWLLFASLPLMIIGAFFPAQALALMGADAQICALGTPYARIFLLFSPAFMVNFQLNAFVRNDADPSLAMKANLTGSFLNILLDPLFMFTFKLVMAGAALATCLSPLSSLLNCLTHLKKPSNHIRLIRCRRLPIKKQVHQLLHCAKLGVPSAVLQISEGVVTTEFNFLTLRLAGNMGIAAFGIISNYSIIVLSMLAGIADGAQPLISRSFGEGNRKEQRRWLKLGIFSGAVLALAVIALTLLIPGPLAALFNSEGLPELARLAETGLVLYFAGSGFAAFNIVLSAYFSASDQPRYAGIISTLRGFAAIVPMALLCARLWGINGVWLSFGAAEAITSLAGLGCLAAECRRQRA